MLQPELTLSGNLAFDPLLPLVEVTAGVYVDEQFVAETTLLEQSSWSLSGGVFSVQISLPGDLPTGEYAVVVVASDGVRAASSEPQTFVYRVPRPPQISIEAPAAGSTYYTPVSIEGTFSVDPALTPVLTAVLQPIDSGDLQDLPLTIEGQSFAGVVTEPGAYLLTVALSDGRVETQATVEFFYVEPEIEVVVAHDYSLSGDGFIETTGNFRFSALIEANVNLQPETFVIEQQVSGVWLPVTEFAPDEVWSAEEQLATIGYDFIESSYGFNDYRLRVRAELQEGLSGVSDLFLVRYRPTEPTLVIDSPVAANTYYRDVAISGSATWDRALSGTVTAALERGDGEVSIPLEVDDSGDFVGTVSADVLNNGANTLRIQVQDSHLVTAEQSVTFNYQVPLLSASFIEPVASGEFEILQPVVGLAGQVTASPAFPLENVSLLLQPVNAEVVPVEIPLLVNGDSQIDGWDSQTNQFSLSLELAQYDLGPGTYDLVIQAQDSFPQQVESDPIRLQYREPDGLDLTLTAPRATTYFAPVQVVGSVFWDPALELELSAELDNLADNAPAQTLGLSRNGNTFSAAVAEPGQYRLTVSASDSINAISRSVDFVYLVPVVEVSVSHSHPLNAYGMLELVGQLTLVAEVANESGVPLTGFGLEILVGNEWQSVASYSLNEVWDEEASSAILTFDFNQQELPYGIYGVRARVDYQGDRFAHSDPLQVNFRALIPPFIELRTPVGGELYLQPISVNGVVSWDAVQPVPTLTARWSLTVADADEPLTGSIPLTIDGERFAGNFNPPSAGLYSFFVRAVDSSGTEWDSEPVTFRFRNPSEFALQLSSPIFEETPGVHVLPQLTVEGVLVYDADAAPSLLQAELLRSDEVVAEIDLLSADAWDPQSGDFSFSLPLSETGEGTYLLRITAADTLARTADAEVAFIYRQPTAPVITVDPLPPIVVGDVSLSGSVDWDALLGETGIERIWADLYFMADTPLLVEQLSLSLRDSAFAETIPSALITSDGSYQLVVRAVDIAGVEADEVVLQFEHFQSDQGVYLPMDALADGGLPDLDGFNNLGKLSGASEDAFPVGVVDRALRFDAERYVEIEDHNEVDVGTGDFSIFVWVKTSRSGLIQSLAEKRATDVTSAPGYTFYLSSRGTPSLQMTSQIADGTIGWTNFESVGLDAPSFVADGLWHHVGVTVDRNASDGLKLYLDGTLVGTFNPTSHTTTLSNDESLLVGRHISWPENYFDGVMDELVIVKRALAPAEIQELIQRAAVTLPYEGALTLTSPIAETYRGSVQIAGAYRNALSPVALEIIDGEGSPVPVSLEFDSSIASGEFNATADCNVFSPGTHIIQARMIDRLEQTLLSPSVTFDFHLPQPNVVLEVNNSDSSGVYIYGRADFSSCPLPAGQSPEIRVFVNERLIDVSVISGQLPGDFIFNISSDWLQQGNNVILVEVVDPRDPEAVAAATITVPFESAFSLSIVNPTPSTTLAGHVQVYGNFTNARGPLNLYSELNGRTFIENIPVNGNQAFAFTIPAEFLQSAESHVLSLRAFDQGTQQEAETKAEFFYRPGNELTPAGDLLAINDMEAIAREENRPWFLNWANFETDFDTQRKNAVLFVASEATCKLVDELDGHCARAKVVLSELYQENGYELSVVERAALAEIPADIKLLILFLPDVEFNEKEILAIKNFAASGGRVVYVGESYSCSDCYSEPAQTQFFQQMGIEIQQVKGETLEQSYKPNGQQHQLVEGIDVIGVANAGVFTVGANVVPLVISEANQVVTAVAKINTNPYEALQIGIDSPRQGGVYDRSQLPPLSGFIEQSNLNSGRPIITATIRNNAARLPEIVDVSECWLTGCVLSGSNLTDDNSINVRAVTPAGFSAEADVRFSVQSPFDFVITSPDTNSVFSTDSANTQIRIETVNFTDSIRVVMRLNAVTVSTTSHSTANFSLPIPLDYLLANSVNSLEVSATSNGRTVVKSMEFTTDGEGGTLVEGSDVVAFNDSNAFLTTHSQNVPFFENLLIFGNSQFRSSRNLVAFDNRTGSVCSPDQQCGQALSTLSGIAQQNGMRLTNQTESSSFYENIPAGVRVIVIWGVINGLSISESDALRVFIQGGGRVVFVGDHPNATIANPSTSNDIYSRLGISVRNVTFDGATNNETLLPNPLARHPLLTGINEIYIGGGGATTYGRGALPLFIADRGPVVIVAKILNAALN